MTVPLSAALYLSVSTARQAEHDVSIPDQRKQGEAYCVSRGYQLVETYVEPGASATNDRRPEFQKMMEAGTAKPAAFDVVIVHSFSRFFRDHFELEFYVRKLAKNGVRLVSMTQELGDDPMHIMMRQIMALFDEYQSKENAKHTFRERRAAHATELRKKAAEAEVRLKRLYDAIESGVADIENESLKERIAELRAPKAQAQADAERATVALQAAGAEITPAKLRTLRRCRPQTPTRPQRRLSPRPPSRSRSAGRDGGG
jgi:DNA invertase Pin-like site-specific DNA recombinase